MSNHYRRVRVTQRGWFAFWTIWIMAIWFAVPMLPFWWQSL